ncbi:MAG: glycosyltransferase [Candidatus Zixiibacteriota bacterium]
MRETILHIALENFANLPWTIIQAERAMGFNSDLVTLYKTFQNFPQEQSLDLPFIGTNFGGRILDLLKGRSLLDNKRREIANRPPVWKPKTRFHKALFDFRDRLWKMKLKNHKIHDMIEKADIIVLDGGSGILRSGDFIIDSGKENIVEVFYGSDLRSRGIIHPVDKLAKLRFTMEFDHKQLYPELEFLYFPFDWKKMPNKKRIRPGETVRIGHSPTKRSTKGTDIILLELEKLKEKYPIEVVLIEGMEYQKAIELKSSCDIFIDQLGELGYGISALEALAMGIPTMVQLMPDFEEFLGDHPFINIEKNNISRKITEVIEKPELFDYFSIKGRNWLKTTHNVQTSLKKMTNSYSHLGWIKGDKDA